MAVGEVMTASIDYSEEEWQAAAGHCPLSSLAKEDLLLLHRHWIWSNLQREACDRALQSQAPDDFEVGPAMMATRALGFMFVWYGMLWSIVESCTVPEEGRNLDFRGKVRDDINRLGPLLRRCRNAILHVPRKGKYYDDRIHDLVAEPDSTLTLQRLHRGLGRMFLEEFRRREQPVSNNGRGA
jgi:hypothetical protein